MGQIGILGLLHIAVVVWALIKIFDSSATSIQKVLWILVVALLPLIGLIVWFFMGPGSPKK